VPNNLVRNQNADCSQDHTSVFVQSQCILHYGTRACNDCPNIWQEFFWLKCSFTSKRPFPDSPSHSYHVALSTSSDLMHILLSMLPIHYKRRCILYTNHNDQISSSIFKTGHKRHATVPSSINEKLAINSFPDKSFPTLS